MHSQHTNHETMPSPSLHEQYIAAYVLYIIIRAIFQPPQTLEDLAQELDVDISSILAICQARYLQSQSPVAKSASLHLAWKYAQNPSDHHSLLCQYATCTPQCISSHLITDRGSPSLLQPFKPISGVCGCSVGCYPISDGQIWQWGLS